MSDDKIVNLEEYRKERNKGTPIPTLKAFQPGHYYIYPEFGMMIHILFTTFDSLHYDNEEVYIMEDQFGNLFSVPIDEREGMIGWRFLEKEVFKEAVKKNLSENPVFEPEHPRVG